MKKICGCCLLALIYIQGAAQTIIQKDPEIEKMVGEINRDSLASYIRTLVGFGTRHTLSSTKANARGIGAASAWVRAAFNAYAKNSHGRMRVEMDKWTQMADGKRVDTAVEMVNIMAILEGTDTADGRLLVISGHLDSRVTNIMDRYSDAPGANDDGSGVAAVMECARVMSTHSFPITVVFVALSGEEQGLLGSEHLAARAKQSNWNILAMINNDIIGGNNENSSGSSGNAKVRIFSEGIPAGAAAPSLTSIRQFGLENDGASRQLARYTKETGERYVDNLEVVMIYRTDRFLRGGDHMPFLEKDFPAVRITEMNENYDHQHQDLKIKDGRQMGDLPEFMDFEYLRKNTAINLSVLANLAKSPSPPKDCFLDIKQLSNFTFLSWAPGGKEKPIGYYILVRETTAPQWQKKIFISNDSLRLPYSKDNYFFGVESVSKEGNESLPVLPKPSR